MIIGLAAYRLALLLVDDNGPFDVLSHFRHLIRADKMEITSAGVTFGTDGWSRLWACMRCVGFWTTLACVGCWQYVAHGTVEVVAIWAIAHLADSAANK